MLTVGDESSQAFGGVISGKGSLVKQGDGVLGLSGANTYSDGTKVNLGTLQAQAQNTIPSLGVVALTENSTLDLNGFDQTIGNLTGSSGNVTLNGATLFVGNQTSQVFGGVISGSGSVAKNGQGTLTLSGANTYLDGTTINAGVLSVSDDLNLGDPSGTIAFSGSGGTLQMTNGISSSRNINLSAPATLLVNAATTTVFSGEINGTAPLIKDGEGTLSLTGTNTYSGGTQILLGTLQAGETSAIPSQGLVSLTNKSTFDLNGFNQTISNLSGSGGSILLNGATLIVGDTTSQQFSGLIAGEGSFIKQGEGVLTLSGANTYTDGTFINGGTLSVSSDQNLGSSLGLLVFGGEGGTLQTTGTIFSSLKYQSISSWNVLG